MLNSKFFINTQPVSDQTYPVIRAFFSISVLVLCFFLLSTLLPSSFKRIHPLFDQVQPAFTAIQIIALIRWINAPVDILNNVPLKISIILSCISTYLFIYRYAVTYYNAKHIFILVLDFIIAIAILVWYDFLNQANLTVLSKNICGILHFISPVLSSVIFIDLTIQKMLFISSVIFFTILVLDRLLSVIEPIRVKIRQTTLKNRAIELDRLKENAALFRMANDENLSRKFHSHLISSNPV